MSAPRLYSVHAWVISLALLSLSDALDSSLIAQEKIRPETVMVNLANPCGVVVQRETGLVFVSSRWGVYRYDPNLANPSEHKANIEIDDYPEPPGSYGKSPKYEIGPLGLAFMDKDHLVVGGGSRKFGEELVRVYKISAAPPVDWLKETAALYTLGPIKAGKDSAQGEGDFFGVAVGANAVWVTCNGDESKGWVAKAEIKEGKPGELKPTIATTVLTGTPAPCAITFSADGKDLVVGQMGTTDTDAADSLIAFYDPSAGTLKQKMKASLRDITGLAYSPKTKKLYATDFAWTKPQEGGLFELAIDGANVKATRVLKLDKPTALSFDRQGRLYVTQFGTPKPGAAKNKQATDPGSLIVIRPGL
jgi:DNA-binding beta-propeller fold protein YncE